MKDKSKENLVIIKLRREQDSEVTKKIVKEKVDIKNLAVDITKVKKGSKGSIILGCENVNEMNKLKESVQDKLGCDFEIAEPRKKKPKIKIINIGEEIMELKDENIIDTIIKQNEIDDTVSKFHIRLVKKVTKKKVNNEQTGEGRRRKYNSLILEVDKNIHKQIIEQGKINIGWRKYLIYDFCSVKKCFKCWGYYHIAKNCTRQETYFKCAGNHKSENCKSKTKKCINCMFKNKNYNLTINDNHDALYTKCPIYMKAKREEKKRVEGDTK